MNPIANRVLISENLGEISTIAILPQSISYLMILGHGAGANMTHHFMEGLALALAKVNVGTLRYNFPYMEKGGGRPDPPVVAHKTIERVIFNTHQKYPQHRLVLGGKSFGGRMASQAIAKHQFPEISALIFYGFPLHSPAKPGIERAEHLFDVQVPMLFLQGSKDTLARIDLLSPLLQKLPLATPVIYEGGDHSFKFAKKTGIDQDRALQILAEDTAKFLKGIDGK